MWQIPKQLADDIVQALENERNFRRRLIRKVKERRLMLPPDKVRDIVTKNTSYEVYLEAVALRFFDHIDWPAVAQELNNEVLAQLTSIENELEKPKEPQ